MPLPKDFDAQAVYLAASNAAKGATNEFLAEHGDRDCCGFAWVTIHPARGKFVSWCKKNNIGSKAYGGGWQIWNPSEACTQALTAKEKGAQAFARILKENGLTAHAGSRMD